MRSMPNHDFESVSVASVERLAVNPHDSLAHNHEEQTKEEQTKEEQTKEVSVTGKKTHLPG